MLLYVFILFQSLLAVYLLYYIIAFVNGAPFVPSTDKTSDSMISLARIKKGTVCYDLGSGDGRLVRLALRKGARAIGIEINPLLALYANLRGCPTRWENLWNARLTDAQVVLVYLMPWHMDKLARKLKRELTPGTLIVTNSFIFPGWKIIRQDKENHVYVFCV